MHSLPYIARMRLLTQASISMEIGLLVFFAIAVNWFVTSPLTVSSAIGELVYGAPALVFPLWWMSRKLAVTTDGVRYRP